MKMSRSLFDTRGVVSAFFLALSLIVIGSAGANSDQDDSGSFLSQFFGYGKRSSEEQQRMTEEENMLKELREHVDRIEKDNQQLRKVVYHLLQQESVKDGTQGGSNRDAVVSGQVEQFQRHMTDEDGNSENEFALMWFKGKKTTIRMGSDSYNSSTIKGAEESLAFHSNNINVHGDNINFSGDKELNAKYKSSELNMNGEGATLKAGEGNDISALKLRKNGNSVSENRFDATIRSGKTVVGFGKQNDETNSGVSLSATESSAFSVAESEHNEDGKHVSIEHEHSESSIDIGKDLNENNEIELSAGSAHVHLSELNSRDDESDLDSYFTFVMQSDDAVIGFGRAVDCTKLDETASFNRRFAGILLDGGNNGSVMLSSGEAAIFMSDGNFGNYSQCQDIEAHDVVLTTGENEFDQAGAMHFISGNARLTFSESGCTEDFCKGFPILEGANGTALRAGEGDDLYVTGGDYDGRKSGSVHILPGTDEVGSRVGNVYLGGGEGFTAVYTGTLNITFFADDEHEHWAANVSLLDHGSCGIKGYQNCSQFDLIFVTSRGAAHSAQVLDEEACLVYIRARPFDKVLWECSGYAESDCEDTFEHDEPFVHFMIMQRRNAVLNPDSDSCDPDTLF